MTKLNYDQVIVASVWCSSRLNAHFTEIWIETKLKEQKLSSAEGCFHTQIAKFKSTLETDREIHLERKMFYNFFSLSNCFLCYAIFVNFESKNTCSCSILRNNLKYTFHGRKCDKKWSCRYNAKRAITHLTSRKVKVVYY